MHLLLSKPPKQKEIEILRHLDLELMQTTLITVVNTVPGISFVQKVHKLLLEQSLHKIQITTCHAELIKEESATADVLSRDLSRFIIFVQKICRSDQDLHQSLPQVKLETQLAALNTQLNGI